jgi:mannose-1-phosphate guanylyltransferase
LTEAHESFYRDEVGDVAPSSLLIQRYNRGTAPAILYSLTHVQHLDPKGTVAFFPSDHYIGDDSVLHRHVDSAFRQAESHPRTVFLLGMLPDTAEVDYGWIQPGAPLSGVLTDSIFHVDRFWEKPSQSLAYYLMNSGCLWNSFIMVGRVEAFLSLIRDAAPALSRSFMPVKSSLTPLDQGSLSNLYSRIPTMNFSQEVSAARPTALAVLRADGLEWSDLGDPGRVLSIASRKGIQKEWSFDLVAEASAAGRIPA